MLPKIGFDEVSHILSDDEMANVCRRISRYAVFGEQWDKRIVSQRQPGDLVGFATTGDEHAWFVLVRSETIVASAAGYSHLLDTKDANKVVE